VSVLAWSAKHLPLTDAWWNFPAFAAGDGRHRIHRTFSRRLSAGRPDHLDDGNPVLAYNVLELACFTLNGVAAYALVRELTTPVGNDRLRAAHFSVD
jgi:hypothetical protein